nr:MAG TPA: hypothetical protein [Caudoviricetes sp.]
MDCCNCGTSCGAVCGIKSIKKARSFGHVALWHKIPPYTHDIILWLFISFKKVYNVHKNKKTLARVA